jgi:signal transduction histidine kinase
LTLELPLSDMLGSWLAPERDPRDWQILWDGANLAKQMGLQAGLVNRERADSLKQDLQLALPLEALGLQLQLQANGNQALKAIYWLLPFIVLIAFLSIFMAAIVSRWLGKRMAAPIVALANAAREVAITGSPTIALQSAGTDEVGQLTHDFNGMLSELALLQEHLQASIDTRSARLSTIFELSPDGFIAFDQRGIASFVNPAFTALTGIERNEILAHDWAHLHQLISTRLANDSVFPKELSEQIMIGLHTPSLKTFLVFKRTSNQGEVILYWRDFTREAEMDAMKTAFLAKAAHELRTPLTSILGFTELLQKDAHANDKQKEIYAIMARQGKSLLNLVRDLLDLARIEAQAQKTHQQSFQSLSALTRLIVEEFKVPGDERKFILALADHLPEVRLDSGQYRQMLSNLLSNALKYSPSGTPVSVTTKLVQRDDKPWLVVSVSDYGMGMQADELARLGERFYRANPRGAVAGTGLGLSVVKELAAAHEGLMEFESHLGQGTRASLWFPAPGQT